MVCQVKLIFGKITQKNGTIWVFFILLRETFFCQNLALGPHHLFILMAGNFRAKTQYVHDARAVLSFCFGGEFGCLQEGPTKQT